MYQRVSLIGRLGADPEVRFTPDGTAVANMRIATDETYKNKAGDKVKRTEWHRVVLFGNLANTASEYLKKGRLIHATGRLHTRQWTDVNGVDRYTTEIIGNSMVMLDSKPATPPPDDDAPHPAEAIGAGDINPEDVPF